MKFKTKVTIFYGWLFWKLGIISENSYENYKWNMIAFDSGIDIAEVPLRPGNSKNPNSTRKNTKK